VRRRRGELAEGVERSKRAASSSLAKNLILGKKEKEKGPSVESFERA